MTKNAIIYRALFFLRFGLGIYLLLFGIDKIVAPEQTIKLFSEIYLLTISSSVSMMIGACEIVLSLFILLGAFKTLTYGLGLLLQTLATLALHEQLFSPFGAHNVFIANLPLVFAFLALFLLRDFDKLWALGKKKLLFAH